MNAEIHQKQLAPAQGIILQKILHSYLGGCFSLNQTWFPAWLRRATCQAGILQ
jgi:hypothetical protein